MTTFSMLIAVAEAAEAGGKDDNSFDPLTDSAGNKPSTFNHSANFCWESPFLKQSYEFFIFSLLAQ